MRILQVREHGARESLRVGRRMARFDRASITDVRPHSIENRGRIEALGRGMAPGKGVFLDTVIV